MTITLFKDGFLFTEKGTFQKGDLLIEGDHVSRAFYNGSPPVPDTLKPRNIVDLKNRYLIPGFIDAHIHLRSLALKSLRCDLGDAGSADDVLRLMSEWAGSHDDRFVVGVDWDESRWPERRYPTRDMLDSIERERPVFARRICGHIGVVNTPFAKLLEAEGVTPDSATGLIEEHDVWVAGRLSSPDETLISNSFDGAIAALHRLGITGIHDIIEPNQFDVYLKGIAESGRRLRIAGLVCTDPKKLDQYREDSKAMDRSYFNIEGIKVFLDGSIGGWTAALNEPYADSPRMDSLLVPEERLARLLRECRDRGYMCAAHAIGDRAVRAVLRQMVDYPKNTRLFRIEHAEIVGAEELDLLRRAPVYAVMQPNFIRNWGGPGGLYEERLGRERAKLCNRFRSFLEAGVRYCFSSDGMPPGPLYGMKGATHHPTPEERIPPGEALLRYTVAARAFQNGRWGQGVFEEGSRADVVVLSGNPLETDTDAVSVLKTYVGGECVYDAKKPEGND
ncbi:MAG: amidohydrolase family protein [Candidatus Latescibacteria bacterium]|nr:amidohydrolase family protein [Candidatus Latescibacterota bacterium]NIM66484.1 amidohydrolase family protein [Candidatus Latescibacterota bacterium]NIO02964.1 amidohydrolase family protein [Candidatus Latescibacterota bacterium]NIO30099.1 amidohydrolase family protein [Candidatus Latescibacterota bacterium]NIO57718.1 amidohydrolase family protein [Candidatus Latescibacterota bacterium]